MQGPELERPVQAHEREASRCRERERSQLAAVIGPGERDDERQQVEPEREHPQQRDCRDFLREVARHRRERQRREKGEREAHERFTRVLRPRPWRRLGGRRRIDPRGPSRFERAPADADREGDERRRPQPALGDDAERPLDHERIADEAGQRPGVREREQAEGRCAGPQPREPGLEQRAGGGERHERQADRGAQQRQDASDRLVGSERRGDVRPALSATARRTHATGRAPAPPRGVPCGGRAVGAARAAPGHAPRRSPRAEPAGRRRGTWSIPPTRHRTRAAAACRAAAGRRTAGTRRGRRAPRSRG